MDSRIGVFSSLGDSKMKTMGCAPRRLAVASLLCLVVAAAPPPEDVPDTAPHPFVRTVFYFMDNCGGTNKSQYAFGAIALLVLTGVLDAVRLMFMVPGHTKMLLDVLFQPHGQGVQ